MNESETKNFFVVHISSKCNNVQYYVNTRGISILTWILVCFMYNIFLLDLCSNLACNIVSVQQLAVIKTGHCCYLSLCRVIGLASVPSYNFLQAACSGKNLLGPLSAVFVQHSNDVTAILQGNIWVCNGIWCTQNVFLLFVAIREYIWIEVFVAKIQLYPLSIRQSVN